jgi:hypothetical protein
MTMHLLGPAYTTTNTAKRKTASAGVTSKYAQEWLDYNKRQKKLGLKAKTFDEYVAYRQGKYNPKLRGTKMPEYKKSNHRELYPSQIDTGVTFAKKPNVYTGDKLLGIATMHKSNIVPVFSKEDAEEISRMRRG